MARRKKARAWLRVSHRTKDLPTKQKRWEVVYEDPAQGFKRRTKGGFESKAAAEDWRDGKECPIGQTAGAWADPAHGDVLFKKVAERWLPTYVSKRGKVRGLQQHAAIINGKGSLLMKQFGGWRIGDITPEAVALWVNGMDRSPSTVRHYFYTLSLVMRYAVRQRMITVDPTIGIVPPAPRPMKDEQADRFPLTWGQAIKLAAAVPEPWGMYVRLGAATGLRPEELAGLQLRDVDDGCLSIRRVVVKDSKAVHGLRLENVAKTAHSHRAIELDDETSDLLDAYIERHKARALVWFSANPDDTHPGNSLPLFVGVDDFRRGAKQRKTGTDADWLNYSKPMRHGWFYARYWKEACTAADVPATVRFYDLRHLHASLLVGRLGQPDALTLTEIAERMGHSTTVLLQRYAHSPRDRSDRRRTALNSLHASVEPENVTRLRQRA